MLAASFADFFLPPPLPSAWQNFFRGEERREGAKRERRNLDIIPPLLLLLLLLVFRAKKGKINLGGGSRRA